MPADGAVEHLDVIEYVGSGGLAIRVDPPFDPPLFEHTEETLGYRVVVAVSSAAHARHDPMRLLEGLPVAAGELAVLVRMHHHASAWFAFPNGGDQRLEHEIAGHRRLRCPAHDLPRIQVHHRGQEQPALVSADVSDVGNQTRFGASGAKSRPSTLSTMPAGPPRWRGLLP